MLTYDGICAEDLCAEDVGEDGVVVMQVHGQHSPLLRMRGQVGSGIKTTKDYRTRLDWPEKWYSWIRNALTNIRIGDREDAGTRPTFSAPAHAQPVVFQDLNNKGRIARD
jgi:hypothetical protein